MGNACKRLAYCCVEPCVEPSDWEPGHSGGGNSYRPSPHGRNSYQEEPARRPIGPNAPGIPAPTIVPPGGPPPPVPPPQPAPPKPQVAIGGGKLPDGVKYELRTLPVTDRRDVGDGDGVRVYVEVLKNPHETSIVPPDVQEALHQRRTALLNRDFATADALETKIEDEDYKIFENKRNQDVLVHNYRVRLRGVDAPEIDQPYGQQARVVLFDLVEGHSLQLFVYNKDPYGRIVADIYCNNKFIQEVLLKRGCVWHFVQYDKRPEFAKWEKEAQAARVGLWVDLNPEKPWDYRKKQRSKSAPRFRSRH
ncbi:unnamed protein product [Sphagnum jensenii]|uniref:TNase-like domain-containing protein n=1 Tax=Sphagnum jensenii TaxID=128206 RepID=A0ABP1BED6_9BRYO